MDTRSGTIIEDGLSLSTSKSSSKAVVTVVKSVVKHDGHKERHRL
jgi:hypothetical protein